jgi:hypothetical protein
MAAPLSDRRSAEHYQQAMMHPRSPYGHPAMVYPGEEQMPPQMLAHGQQANFGIMGDTIDPKTKRRRGNLPKPVTDILRAWFHEHLDHPYPSEEDKQMFMTRTGLSISQVRYDLAGLCFFFLLGRVANGFCAYRLATGLSMLGDDSCLRCGIKCAVAILTRRDNLRSVMLRALSNLPRLTTELITDYGLLLLLSTRHSPRQRLFYDWDGCFSLTILRLTGLRIDWHFPFLLMF